MTIDLMRFITSAAGQLEIGPRNPADTLKEGCAKTKKLRFCEQILYKAAYTWPKPAHGGADG